MRLEINSKRKEVLKKCFKITGIILVLILSVYYVNRYSSPNYAPATKNSDEKIQIDIPRFADYPIEELGDSLIKPLPIDFKSHPKASTFRTVLKKAEANGPNFAYKYTIADWGCGTECHSLAVIDSSNGKVYFPDIGYNVGIDFDINSRLLIVNPPKDIYENYGYDPKNWHEGLETEYYIWENNDFKLIKKAKITYNIVNNQ